jgi:hypothetical protein
MGQAIYFKVQATYSTDVRCDDKLHRSFTYDHRPFLMTVSGSSAVRLKLSDRIFGRLMWIIICAPVRR